MGETGLNGSGVDEAHRHGVSPSGEGHALPAWPRWSGLLPWQVMRVRDYVERHLEGRLSVAAAAERAKLSPSYFSRRFRQSFGQTFPRFVARRRIERAQSMMIRSSCTLCEIAAACGFSDQAHFTRTFGQMVGETPARWRETAVDREGRRVPIALIP